MDALLEGHIDGGDKAIASLMALNQQKYLACIYARINAEQKQYVRAWISKMGYTDEQVPWCTQPEEQQHKRQKTQRY